MATADTDTHLCTGTHVRMIAVLNVSKPTSPLPSGNISEIGMAHTGGALVYADFVDEEGLLESDRATDGRLWNLTV